MPGIATADWFEPSGTRWPSVPENYYRDQAVFIKQAVDAR